MSTNQRFVAITALGTEDVVSEELTKLGATQTENRRGAVAFEGDLEVAYRACLWSRAASRILFPQATFTVNNEDDLYEGMHGLPWEEHIDPDGTLAVDVVMSDTQFTNSRFLTFRAKDAIVDRMREKFGRRPGVDTQTPQVRIHLYIRRSEVTVSVDLAGTGMHRRGIARVPGGAPLKENLAAALLYIAEWPRRATEGLPFVDPMCGSGTLLVEAGWMALDVAPGLKRRHHGMVGWKGHEAGVWNSLIQEAHDRRRVGAGRPLTLFGADASEMALDAARRNLDRADLWEKVALRKCGIEDLSVPPGVDVPGLLVTNPPYGERMGETGELGPLYETLGDRLKREFPGWTAFVLTGNSALAKRIGLKPARRHPLFNGPIDCRFLEFPISEDVVSGEAPAWRKPAPESEMFANRLRKNLKKLASWAKKNDVDCYRIYDADIPEYNVAVDLYGAHVLVQEYARPTSVPVHKAERRLRDVLTQVSEVLNVEPEEVVLKVRRRLKAGEQHEKRAEKGEFFLVREQGHKFRVNLRDYLDTGLFLDQRLVRKRIQDEAQGRDFLNLFSYTCSATVYAAAGGALSTTSVDLSNTYLDWGNKNLEHNGYYGAEHRAFRADCMSWVERERNKFGLIYAAPPIFSRSKSMEGDFDVQRDHGDLLRGVLRILAPGGILYFSTPLKDFVMDEFKMPGVEIRDVTKQLKAKDFEKKTKGPTMWRFEVSEAIKPG